jgi:thioredoxin-related protein
MQKLFIGSFKLHVNFIIAIVSFCPLFSFSQGDPEKRGINWEKTNAWEQIQNIAKKENKFIFVECYATWCIPCKKMERLIFPIEKIGMILNSSFISIRVQMDSSNNDNDYIKNWYADAHLIKQLYDIKMLPTFLFFSPEGKLVHRGEGFKDENEFISLTKEAINPKKQFYTSLENYQNGKKDYKYMPELALAAKRLQYDNWADTIALDYINNYLIEKFYAKSITKEQIMFIAYFPKLVKYKNNIFNLYYDHSEEVDKVVGNSGYSMQQLNTFITQEEIEPLCLSAMEGNSEPDWTIISETIFKKYSAAYEKINLVNAKVEWYKRKKKWEKYTKHLVRKVKILGVENIDYFSLNNFAWEIFQYSNAKAELKRAIRWINYDLKRPVNSFPFVIMDTKANLLYKLGKTKKAIKLEEAAINLEPQFKDGQANLEKIKRGIPTWTIVKVNE